VDLEQRFAANLRRARVAAGLSQEQLGLRCDLHHIEISLLERARREPRLGTIVKLAEALRTTPDALLADAQNQSPPAGETGPTR